MQRNQFWCRLFFLCRFNHLPRQRIRFPRGRVQVNALCFALILFSFLFKDQTDTHGVFVLFLHSKYCPAGCLTSTEKISGTTPNGYREVSTAMSWFDDLTEPLCCRSQLLSLLMMTSLVLFFLELFFVAGRWREGCSWQMGRQGGARGRALQGARRPTGTEEGQGHWVKGRLDNSLAENNNPVIQSSCRRAPSRAVCWVFLERQKPAEWVNVAKMLEERVACGRRGCFYLHVIHSCFAFWRVCVIPEWWLSIRCISLSTQITVSFF